MKNTFSAVIMAAFFAVAACKKTDRHITASATEAGHNQEEKLIVDSVKINDSIQVGDSLTARYTSRMLVFPGLKDRTLLDSIYFQEKNLRDFSKTGLQALLEKKKNEYFNDIRKDSKDGLSDMTFAQEWYYDAGMNLKSVTNGYLHIEYAWGSYSGGAHDNYGFSERVFDLRNNRKVELKDITSLSGARLEALLMKNIDALKSGSSDNGDEVKNSDMLLVDVIPATGNFYFDDRNLYFRYSPYEIAAFAAGDLVIPVSWKQLEGSLNPQFKERMKIR